MIWLACYACAAVGAIIGLIVAALLRAGRADDAS